MQRLRTGFIIYLAIAFWLFFPNHSSTVLTAAEGQTDNVCFNWAFGALIGDQSSRQLVNITRDTELKTGDHVKMLVELRKKCYVYLIYYSSQGEFHLLFPREIGQFSRDYLPAEKHYIPQEEQWFMLDENTGTEKFYLLASANRLTSLESMLEDYVSAGSAHKSELVDEILTEIKRLRRKHKKFQSAAERPAAIGGTIRGKNKVSSIAEMAVEITAADFYSRVFTIEHH